MRWIVLLCLVGCSTSKEKPAATAAGSASAGTLTAKDVAGYWTGDWGQLVFREKDGKMYGAYSHDQGTIVGTLQGGMLVGWWCEVPSRKPDDDAGDVEMKFVKNAAGNRAIDGRWRYGATGNWHDDWDIAWDAGQPDQALVQRFDDPSAFCAKP